MFAKSSSSLRKKVKYVKRKLCGEEKVPQTQPFWLPPTDGASDNAMAQGEPNEDAEMSSLFDIPILQRDSDADEPTTSAAAGASTKVKTSCLKTKDSDEVMREGDVLRAGNIKGKGVGARSSKHDDTDDDDSRAKEREFRFKKFYMGGRIKIRPSTRSHSFSDSSIDSSTGSIVDANTVFRRWPDAELALQREVIEKYEAGKKLWTKESLVEMERRIADANPVRLDAYAGEGEDFEKQEGSGPPPYHAWLPRKLTPTIRLTYRAEFHGYQDLAFPPPSRPNGKPYCPVAVQTMPFDYSRTKDPKAELDTFHHYTAYWLGHPLGRMFMAAFMKVPLPPYIDKIVCFDLGSITRKEADYYGYVRRAIYKHAAAMSIVEAVHSRFGNRIRLVVQDTNYCSECAEVLFAKNFTVVGEHGAQGLAEVDDKTLVFAPNPRFCVKEVIADIAEPAAMFWGTVRSPEETEEWTRSVEPVDLDDRLSSYYHEHEADPDTPRVRELIKKYNRHPFPTNNLFGAVSLYTRAGRCVSTIEEEKPSPIKITL
ncbi:hypothetical protein F4818DRAFT_446472 [Hypoxylon cercidicola]|nr:hypothetical protein F4818DRAFT_446472 [Hypoxylon cercidicola]